MEGLRVAIRLAVNEISVLPMFSVLSVPLVTSDPDCTDDVLH